MSEAQRTGRCNGERVDEGRSDTAGGHDAAAIERFRDVVWRYYRANRRLLPWRREPIPYYVLVSEFMLQQTQVPRVVPKFEQFVARFPDLQSLAAGPFAAVVEHWQGLGYNRRARYLFDSARVVVRDFAQALPLEPERLRLLPGVGEYTANAVACFAYNVPTVFIETNIRRVFLHHWFAGETAVTDARIRPLVAACVDHQNPREWYYALMDYGSALPRTAGNDNRRSAHYTRQSAFASSDRRLRGLILRQIAATGECVAERFAAYAGIAKDRADRCVQGLVRDGLVVERDGVCRIPTN